MESSSGENLIFLISQPRAGSTLFQLLLAGHPDIATTSEPWIALHPIYALQKNGIDTEYDSNLARCAILDFLQQSGVDELFYKKQVASFLLSFYRKSLEYQKKKLFLDKTPRYYEIIDDLAEIFPKAKFIVLIRNPLGVLSSILKTWIKDDLSRIEKYRRDLIVAPQKLVDFVKNNPETCLKIKYEELVANPDQVLMIVCKFIGISFSKNMLEYGGRENSDWRFGDPVGVHNTVSPVVDSLESWKEGFTSPQDKLVALTYIENLGSDLIEEMGYNYNEIKTFIKPLEKFWSDESIDSKKKIYKSEELEQIFKFDKKSLGEAKIKSLVAEIDSIHNTISWKATKPLRLLGKLFKG